MNRAQAMRGYVEGGNAPPPDAPEPIKEEFPPMVEITDESMPAMRRGVLDGCITTLANGRGNDLDEQRLATLTAITILRDEIDSLSNEIYNHLKEGKNE